MLWPWRWEGRGDDRCCGHGDGGGGAMPCGFTISMPSTTGTSGQLVKTEAALLSEEGGEGRWDGGFWWGNRERR